MSSERESSGHADFLGLLLPNRRRIFRYVYTLVPSFADAEDILQETCVTLWDKFDEFEPGTDFVAWACRVAYWKVKQFRTRQGRSKISFSQPVVDSLSETIGERMGELDSRREALEKCLGKLDERDRAFVLSRYEPGGSVANAATLTGRSIQATYKALSRIRRALLDCVTRTIAAETGP